jgi:hypothetical protein
VPDCKLFNKRYSERYNKLHHKLDDNPWP